METKQVLGPHLQTLQPLKLQGPKGTFLYTLLGSGYSVTVMALIKTQLLVAFIIKAD